MSIAQRLTHAETAPPTGRPFIAVVVGDRGIGDAPELALAVMHEAGFDARAVDDVEAAYRALREGAGLAIVPATELDGAAVHRLQEALDEAVDAVVLLLSDGGEAAAGRASSWLSNGERVVPLGQPLRALDLLMGARAAMRVHHERCMAAAARAEHDRITAALAGAGLDAAAPLLDESRVPLLLAAADGTVRHLNHQWLSLAGLSVDEAIGGGWLSAIHPDDAEGVWQAMRFAGTKQLAEPCEIDFHMRRADGQLRTVRQRVASIAADDGSSVGSLALLIDVTELCRARAELRALSTAGAGSQEFAVQCAAATDFRGDEAHRTAAIATLSAGLGHDLGNMVFPLRIHLDMMESKGLPAKFRDDLSSIRQAVEHLQRLATGLRHLAMDPDETGVGAESADLHEWWVSTVPVLKNALPRGIALQHHIPAGLPMAAVAAHALTQAVFNLVQNAGEALQRRDAAAGRDAVTGTVRISAEPGDERRSVRLHIADDGPGMSEEVRRRCLDPYFTTKTRRLSTGLGLPLVRGIMERVGGRIDIESEPGRGTTWTLSIPAAAGESSAEGRGASRRAIVSLSDARLRAFVITVLQSMEFEVTLEGPSTNGDAEGARLWITEPIESARHRAEAFLRDDERRRVVVFGALPEGGSHPRIIETGEASPTAAIRRVLHSIVGKSE